jgi:hypothetical protein
MGIPNDDSYQRSVLKELRLKSQPISGQNWRTTRPTSTSQEKKKTKQLNFSFEIIEKWNETMKANCKTFF